MLFGPFGAKTFYNLENPINQVQNNIVKVSGPAQQDALNRIAQRLFWWKPAAEALDDQSRFLAQVMTFGTWEDVQTTREIVGEQAFRETLKYPPSGVFDEASWSYWHHVFGIEPIPALPKRELC